MLPTQNLAILALMTDASTRLEAYKTEFTSADAIALQTEAATATSNAIKRLAKAIGKQLSADNP